MVNGEDGSSPSEGSSDSSIVILSVSIVDSWPKNPKWVEFAILDEECEGGMTDSPLLSTNKAGIVMQTRDGKVLHGINDERNARCCES